MRKTLNEVNAGQSPLLVTHGKRFTCPDSTENLKVPPGILTSDCLFLRQFISDLSHLVLASGASLFL